MRHPVMIATAALVLSAAAAPRAHAQLATGPTATAATLSPRLDAAATDQAAPMYYYGQGLRTSYTLMIVGGAAIITGAIIGGDAGTVIIIGGAAVGLYGLYLYLHNQPGRVGVVAPDAIGVGYRYELPR